MKDMEKKNRVSDLVMAGSSCDDIYVIILFNSFKSLVASNTFDYFCLLKIPPSIISGILLGLIVGIVISFIFKKFNINTPGKIIIMLSFSFIMIFLEELIKQHVSVSSLLAIIVIAIIISKKYKNDEVVKIKNSYENLWNGFEILLFTLIGCITDANLAFSKYGLIILGLILIDLVFRSISVILCAITTKYTWKKEYF